jgi:putative transposase
MITHRCSERRLFLAPDDDGQVSEHIGYCMGLALQRTGVRLNAACWMGNHHHTDVADPEGRVPEFKEYLHSQVARGINALRGREENLWRRGGSHDTRKASDDESLRSNVYTLTNPVKAGLVKTGGRWPGFTTHGWKFGEVRRFRRSEWYFDADNPDMPPYVEIKLERPQIMLHLTDDELYEVLMGEVEAEERKVQNEMAKDGRRFKGENKLRKQNWRKAPTTPNPTFAAAPRVHGSKWPRITQLSRDREWDRAYAEARESQARGEDAVFPYGTYWLRVRMGVKVAAAP